MSYRPQVQGEVDTGNSSTDNLGISAVFTGAFRDILAYNSISVLVDGASASTAPGTLQMQFSHDGSTVHRDISVAIADVAAANPRTLGAIARYFRVIYTNGAVAQTDFDLQVINHQAFVRLVSRLDAPVASNSDVQNTRSIIAGLDVVAGTFKNVSVATTSNDDGTYQSLHVASGARPSELPGRTVARIVLDHITADTLAYTVTADKTLYVTDIQLSVGNSASGAGALDIYDDTAPALTGLVLPVNIADPGSGGDSAVSIISHHFIEPLAFENGIYLDEAAGTLDIAGVILGYEE